MGTSLVGKVYSHERDPKKPMRPWELTGSTSCIVGFSLFLFMFFWWDKLSARL